MDPRGTVSAPRRGWDRSDAELEPVAGQVLCGRYELVAQIGRGGMALVWSARQRGSLDFERRVAIKFLRPEVATDAAARKMFLREARIASRLHHPHVVDVLDVGEDQGFVFQVMPLVEGASLATLLAEAATRGHPCLPGMVVRIALDVLSGLHAAHETNDTDGGVVHRDVTPHNVLVDRRGVARVADFGIAKVLSEETTGSVRGKVNYMAPEQLRGERLDRRCDLYAVGIMLWEAFSGERLFRDIGISNSGPRKARPLAEVARSIPSAVAAVVDRALASDRDARFATAADMSAALETAARAGGILGSTDDVARWVEPLLPGEHPPVILHRSERPPTDSTETIRRGRNWLRLGIVGAALGLVAAVVLVVAMRRAQHRSTVANSLPPASSTPAPPDTTTASATPSSLPAEATTAEVKPSASPPPRPRTPAAPRARSSAPPSLRYGDNPYSSGEQGAHK